MLVADLAVVGGNADAVVGLRAPLRLIDEVAHREGVELRRAECQALLALIARPTKSLVLYSQMVGRAIRGPRAGGNREAEIVTVVDTALPGFRSL